MNTYVPESRSEPTATRDVDGLYAAGDVVSDLHQLSDIHLRECGWVDPGKLGIGGPFQDDRRPDACELPALPTRDLVGDEAIVLAGPDDE